MRHPHTLCDKYKGRTWRTRTTMVLVLKAQGLLFNSCLPLSLSIRPPYLKLWKANSAKCIGVFSALSRNKSTQTMALVRSSNSRKEKQRTPHCSNAEKAIAIVVRNTREKRMRLDRRGQKGERERKEIKTDEIKCFKRLKITLCFFGFFPLFLFYVENHAKISCTSIEIFIYFWRFPFSAPSRCLLM